MISEKKIRQPMAMLCHGVLYNSGDLYNSEFL